MPKPIRLVQLADLEISARPSAFVGFALFWLLLSLMAYTGFRLDLPAALMGGFSGTLLHFASELWHNLGHALAARRTGYPMSGVVFWGVLATSRYPANQGSLPGRVHIQRALGGPLASALLAALAGLLLTQMNPAGLWFWLAAFFFTDNLLVFTFGSLLPLGFTDGSTLLAWWGRP